MRSKGQSSVMATLQPSRRDHAGMADHSSVSFSTGVPETALPDPPPDAVRALADAVGKPVGERHEALAAVAAAHPAFLEAWAALAEETSDPVTSYAFARVGYHRGLDALRRAGWRGSGYVRWARTSNRGFLRCLDALRRAAGAIGEADEEERCRIFLGQLDPDWARK